MKERVETKETDEMVKCIYNNTVLYIDKTSFSSAVLRMPIGKKFVRYKEGAALYSMSERKFIDLAKNAEAVRHIDKIALVSLEAIDKYIELNN